MHSPRVRVEPFRSEPRFRLVSVKTRLDDMILMHAVWNAAIPDCNAAEFFATAVSLDKQDVPVLQTVRLHLSLGDVNGLDLPKVQMPALHVGYA